MADSELRNLRGRARAALDRMSNSADSTFTRNELLVRLERLDAIWQEFVKFDAALPAEESEIEEFENSFFVTKAVFRTALDAFERPKPENETLSSQAPVASNIKLPRLNISIFSGNYLDWPSFKDLFCATVHSNDSLSKIQKFQYLKGLLSEEPASLIRHIPVSEGSYDEAWDKLVQRYDKKKQIVTSLIKTFLDQPSVSRASEIAIRRIADVSDEVIRGLKSLSEEANNRDPWLIHLLLSKLDPETQQLWAQRTAEEDFPTFESFIDFLNNRCSALACYTQNAIPSKTPNPNKSQSSSSRSYPAVQRCVKCRGAHPLYKCVKFKELDVAARRNFVRKHALCFNCMKDDHKVYSCNSNAVCHHCGQNHHTMLHEDLQNNYGSTADNVIPDKNLPNVVSSNSDIATHTTQVSKAALLPTATVAVADSSGSRQNCRILLDSGSQATFVSESCIQRLGLRRTNNRVTVKGLASSEAAVTKGSVTLSLSSIHDPNDQLIVQAYVLNKLTSPLPSSFIEAGDWEYIKSIQLADPSFATPQKIDIIVGADYFFSLLRNGKIVGIKNSPIAQNTIFGWVLSGNISTNSTESISQNICLLNAHVECNVDQMLRRFWEVENLPCTENMSTEEEYCETHFKQNYTVNEDGKFVVKLPFVKTTQDLGCNKRNALSRLSSMERRFKKNEDLAAEYKNFMHEYQTLGHMDQVKSETNPVDDGNVYFLPHHAVFKPSSSTTKLRVVFDASSGDVSLNSKLGVGKNVQRDIFSILLCFRLHVVAFTADIEKMYRQVFIAPEDRSFQRIVWRDDVNSDVKEYELCTVTYGTASAPFLATRSLLQIALDCEDELPEISDIIKEDFYMDDLLSGAGDSSEAIRLTSELKGLLEARGFHLRKWKSNDTNLIQSLSSGCHEGDSLEISSNSECSKVLGLYWDSNSDSFLFRVNIDATGTATKREILSKSSRIFDPLGWLSPCTIFVKILYQQLWLQNIDWDDCAPKELAERWTVFVQELNTIGDIRIPRWLHTDDGNVELHGFCDASESAYAAVIYCRKTREDGIEINLLVAKTRVAPIKQISVPRLELCGALLLARLYDAVRSALRHCNIDFFAWTDSKVVLAWLSSHPRKWKTFVANRTSEILEIVPREKWSYVPTKQNPADVASRGIRPHQLQRCTLWWNGPSWLKEDEKGWPKAEVKGNHENSNALAEERTKTIHCMHASQLNDTLTALFDHYSSLSKITRIIAYCRRFIFRCKERANIREPSAKSVNSSIPLSFAELDEALKICIRWVQENSFSDELKCLRTGHSLSTKSKLRSFLPFVDDNGILRVGGRLQQSSLAYSAKHPIILPNEHKLSVLLIRQFHVTYLHAGPTLLSNILRQSYWIIRSKRVIKSIVNKCTVCSRYNTPSQQLMGNLPEPRVVPNRPFVSCGVDYAGPISIRTHKGRSAKIVKGYIALFVCLSTKAVHAEVVSDLSSDAFIAALRRFSSRRGTPRHIYSDNASNFVGAKHKMADIYKFASSINDDQQICYYLSQISCEWHMIPPTSPHFGGIWEAGIRSTKFHLKRVIGDSVLTFEELTTLLTQIEAILNSRPLTPINADDTASLDVLTPSHFLVGDIVTSPPEVLSSPNSMTYHSRWELVQKLKQGFWKRWHQDYLNSLQGRSKWKDRKKNFAVGEIVLIREENTPPSTWPLGRIVEVHPGKDGLVRVTTVKTAKGLFKRSVVKLIRLSVNQE